MNQLDWTQRWTLGRCTWQHRRALFDPQGHEVILIDRATAASFVTKHHYSASMPAARWSYALVHRQSILGVMVYAHPVNDLCLTSLFGGQAIESVELSRLVLLNDVGFGAESWAVARSFNALRRLGLRGVLSHSDPNPRYTSDQRCIMPGHVGIVYQALSATYVGPSRPRTVRLLPSGRVVNERTLQKIRALERGYHGAIRQLVAAGAAEPGPDQDLRRWLDDQLAAITRRQRTVGVHRYAWALQRVLRPATAPQPAVPVAARGPRPTAVRAPRCGASRLKKNAPGLLQSRLHGLL